MSSTTSSAGGMASPWTGERWRRIGVYGGGLSGRAAAAFLRRQGVEVVLWDGRPATELSLGLLPQDPGVTLRAGAEPGAADLAGLDAVVASPGVPADRPLFAAARERGLPVLAEVELAFPFLDGEVLAITGSNGKSTTTAMTAAMVEAGGRAVELCGNIGVPLCSRIEGDPGRVFVVELSSFQLESTRLFRPKAAALLNLSPDHLDRHGSMAAYRDAKARVFLNQGPSDVAILNADDAWLGSLPTPGRRRRFSLRRPLRDGAYRDGEVVLEAHGEDGPSSGLFAVADVPLPGLHNLENAMAAALLARAVGTPPAAIVRALRAFPGLPHRVQKVRELAGVVYYDDSKGTNLGATARSLEGFPDRSVHLVLGGRNKGADLSPLRPLAETKAKRVYLIGEAADELTVVFTGSPLAVERCFDLARAVERAAREAAAGEVVLLSPACASFDQFKNYVERGQAFQRLVAALPADPGARRGP